MVPEWYSLTMNGVSGGFTRYEFGIEVSRNFVDAVKRSYDLQLLSDGFVDKFSAFSRRSGQDGLSARLLERDIPWLHEVTLQPSTTLALDADCSHILPDLNEKRFYVSNGCTNSQDRQALLSAFHVWATYIEKLHPSS